MLHTVFTQVRSLRVFLLVDTAQLWASIGNIESATLSAVDSAAAKVADDVARFVDDVQQLLSGADFTPHDYDPPTYPASHNVSEEPSAHKKNSDVSFIFFISVSIVCFLYRTN
jgi:hypothetical protein